MDELITCSRCGMQKPPASVDSHMCRECQNAENSRLTYYRQHQDDWIALAKESGLDMWVMQPGETQWEYTIWTTFRDSYPGKRPRISDVAKQLNTTYNVVNKVSQRWNFNLRMQAWMRYVDDITLAQRRSEILSMNEQHISMSERLRAKMARAIENIDENNLTPSEIVALTKMSADLERRARVDTIAQAEMTSAAMQAEENPGLKKHITSPKDLTEILGILQKTGALKVTQTTEMSIGPECVEIGSDDA